MVTINPADCDRTTVYAGECRNFQDTEWITFNSGRRRSPNARDGNTWLIDVAHGSFWMTDDQVRNLVRLVPAREVTRNDQAWIAPELCRPHDAYVGLVRTGTGLHERILRRSGPQPQCWEYWGSPEDGGMNLVEDDAVSELKPICPSEFRRLRQFERAHAIVEQERDQARSERDEANRNRDEAASRLAGVRDAHQRSADAHMKWKARAEAAEARTAPAVTRDDVLDAVTAVFEHERNRGDDGRFAWPGTRPITDAVCALFAIEAEPADPAVFVVRESDLPEVSRTYDGWTDGTRHGWEGTSETAMECVETHLEWARFYLAASRAIEAEQPDPVEAKARELYEAAYPFEGARTWAEVAHIEHETFQRLAAHVLGQEADQ